MNALRHLLKSWASVSRHEAMLLLGVSLLFGAIDLSDLLQFDAGPRFWPVVAHHLTTSLAATLAIGLCWLPADRSRAPDTQRIAYLTGATLAGAVLAALTIWELTVHLPWPSLTTLAMQKEHRAMPVLGPLLLLSFTLQVLLPVSLAVIATELLRRQHRASKALQQVLADQALLRRRAMAARLAALQAQVEPQLLFDALVEIEQAYAQPQERPDNDAADRLERLIGHLRVALPRLRDTGTTLDAEAELLDSYLCVMHDLLPRAPSLLRIWDAALGQISLPPMLLLPLVQGALRQAGTDLPSECRLEARRSLQGLRIELRFDRINLCSSAAEMAEFSRRMALLARPGARFACHITTGHTVYTLELPQ